MSAIQAVTAKSKLDEVIYENFVKYHVENRVFSYREYRNMVLQDPDHVKDLERTIAKGKLENV